MTDRTPATRWNSSIAFRRTPLTVEGLMRHVYPLMPWELPWDCTYVLARRTISTVGAASARPRSNRSRKW